MRIVLKVMFGTAVLISPLIVGCSKKASDSPTEVETSGKKDEGGPASRPSKAKAPVQIPIPADFAKAAQREITADNYKAEISAIESELDQE